MRKPVSICLSLAAAAVFVPVAGAAPSLTPTGDATFPERSFVLTLPSGTQARAGQIAVKENGGQVAGLEVESVGAEQRARLGVTLVLDTSRSMRGRPVAGALAAARAFARERNERQPLSLVTFNSEINVAMPLTTDAYTIQQALAEPLEAGGRTHLYDAGLRAVETIREADLPGGFVVILSDGSDYGSETSLAQLTAAARDSHVRVYTVGLRSPRFNPDAMKVIAESAGGAYSEAHSPADLSGIYSTLSAELSNAYLLRYRSVAEPRVGVKVSASVSGVGSTTATYTSPPLAVSDPGGSDDSVWSSSVAVAIAVIVIATLFALAVVALVRRRRQTPRERVEDYVAPRDATLEEAPTLTDRLASTTERSLSQAAWWGRFNEAVDIAGFAWPAARLLTNSVAIAAALGLLLAVATGVVALFFLCVVLTPFVISVVVKSRVRKQRRLFADQLADHLAVVGSTLRAGHSFPAALASTVNEAPEPSRREFERAVADERLGAPLDEALEEVARRMDSRDLEQVALLALLQRESGADAAEMLDGVVETIRERQKLRRTVRTLTAQGRLSRTILTGLPVFSLIGLTVMNPGYVDPLVQTGIGRALVVATVVMLISGSLIIKRIVNFEI